MIDINNLSDVEYAMYKKAIDEYINMTDSEKYNEVVRNKESIWEVLG